MWLQSHPPSASLQGPYTRRRRRTGRRGCPTRSSASPPSQPSPLVGHKPNCSPGNVWCLLIVLCVSNSDCSSVGLGRDRCLSPRALAGDHVELPEVHHGSSPAAASGFSQGCRCYGNAVVNPLSLALPLPLLQYFNSCLHPQAVDITSCGNFAVVGSSSGRVDVYNMQSGLHRGCYGDGGTGK